MEKYINNCSLCGRKKELIRSNNPLVKSLCSECLNKEIDRKSLVEANFFCKTYNIPFNPNKWLKIEKESGTDVFKNYVNLVAEENKNSLYNSSKTDMLWTRADKEWQKDLTNEELIKRIIPIKEGFIKRMQIQWGSDYSFQEFLKLENLYTNTVRSNAITNPLTLDMIKKIAIVSIKMDRALEDGEIQTAAELNKMHTTLIKGAGLDDLVEVSDENVISNVSELCKFIEDNHGEFKFYDDVTRDIVDKTIKDQEEWIRHFVIDNAGISTTYKLIEEQYKNKMENETLENAAKQKPLEDLDTIFEKAKSGHKEEFDKEIEEEDIDIGGEDDEINDPAF